MAVAALDRFVLDHLCAVGALLHVIGLRSFASFQGYPNSPGLGGLRRSPRGSVTAFHGWTRRGAGVRLGHEPAGAPGRSRSSRPTSRSCSSDRPGVQGARARRASASVATSVIEPSRVPRPRRLRPGRASTTLEARRIDTRRRCAGYMRLPGTRRSSTRSAGRWLNVHPALLPSFPGTHGGRATRWRTGVKVTGVTVHPGRRGGRHTGRSCCRRRSRSATTTTGTRSSRGSTPPSIGCCRAAVRALLEGRLVVDGRHVRDRRGRHDERRARPIRRAIAGALRQDGAGGARARALVEMGVELVVVRRHRAACLREAGRRRHAGRGGHRARPRCSAAA